MRIASIILARALPLVLAVAMTHAGTSVDESAIFQLETRTDAGTVVSLSNDFALDARERGNAGTSGSMAFALNTVAGSLESLVITGGPATVAPGQAAAYQCTATFSGGGSLDVSTVASWQIVGNAPSGVGFVGNTLNVGANAGSATFSIRASYAFPSGVRFAPAVAVSVQPGLRVTIAQSPAPTGSVSLSASASGGPAPFQFAWDLDDDGAFDDATGANAGFAPGAGSGNWRVGVRVTDAALATATAFRIGSAEKAPVANQPEYTEPRYDVGDGILVSAGGGDFQFVTARTSKGMIVIVHGLRQDETAEWMGQKGMAKAIEDRLGAETPNIALFGWGHYALDPGELPQSGLERLRAVAMVSTALGLAPAILGYADETAVGLDFLIDAIYVRKIGMTLGMTLANWVYHQTQGATPNIDTSKPIHLIGHSAGGFVVGECARILETLGIPVDRVTLLDTPFADITHVGSRSTDYPNLGHTDQIISSFYGFLGSPAVMRLTTGRSEHPYYHREVLNSALSASTAFDTGDNGHGRSISWYIDETINGSLSSGFFLSPFVAGPTIPRLGGGGFSLQALKQLALSGEALTPDEPIGGFETFGDAISAGDTWTLTEEADAGIWKLLTIPLGAESLKFSFRFLAPGDGDFLAVRFGDGSDLYYGQDLPISRDNAIAVEIPLAGLQTQAGKLVFTLVSRENANAVVELSDVRFGMTDDTDADGLTNDEEDAIGCDPLETDTDGDGLDDAYEVQTVGTTPTNVDTDGDGKWDSDELHAGTSPLDGGSFFRIDNITRDAAGMITLRWQGHAGRWYRIHRSTDIGTLSYDTIASDISGFDGQLSHTSMPPAGAARCFYWIEVQ